MVRRAKNEDWVQLGRELKKDVSGNVNPWIFGLESMKEDQRTI